MFQCGFCGNNSKHGEKLVRVPVAFKTAQHPARHDAHRNNPDPDKRRDPGGQGSQIAKENNACEACVALMRKKQEQETLPAT